MIKFGEFLPDQNDLENPGVTRAENALPVGGVLIAFPSPTAVSTNALSSRPMGVISFIGRDGVSRTYVGVSDKLYGLSAVTHVDYSRAAGYSVSDEEGWDFVKYDTSHTEYIIASNGTDLMQYLAVGDTTFADITDGPRARHIGVSKGFLIAASQQGNKLIVDWSASSDPFTWPEVGTQVADAVKRGQQTLNNNGGPIHGVVSGDTAYILQENAISRMQFVGGSTHFDITNIADIDGVISRSGWVKIDDLVYYISRDGLKVFDGARSKPLGHGKVDSYFLDDLDSTYTHRVTLTDHPKYPLLIINYPDSNATSGNPNQQLIFNYVTGQWSTGTNVVNELFASFGRGLTVDTLDTLSATIDGLTTSVDAASINRGAPILSAYSAAHTLTDFSGSALDAVIETTEMANEEDRLTHIMGVRPAIEAGTVTSQVSSRLLQTDAETWGTITSLQSSGIANHRILTRYFKFRFNISGLTKAAGFFPKLRPGGFR